jgi:hypothetical protein
VMGSALDVAQNRNDVRTAGVQPVDRVDEVLAAQRGAGQTVGGQAEDSAPDAAQNSPPRIIERLFPTTGPLLVVMLIVLSMIMVVLGLIRFLFRHTYAQPVLTYSEPRLLPSPDHVRPVNFSWPPPNQVEADPDLESLQSVKKALDVIEESVAEIDSSRQLRRRSWRINPEGCLLVHLFLWSRHAAVSLEQAVALDLK